MQVLDSVSTHQLNNISPEILNTLEDIVNKVQIQSYFSISHPEYKPLELPIEVVRRFKKIPLNIQSQYLNKQLENFIYGIYYNASLRKPLALDANSTNPLLHQNLENNIYWGIYPEFVLKLHENNVGKGYLSQGWDVVKQENDGTLAVKKDGLTLHIKPDCCLQPGKQEATVGEVVAIRLPRNLVQNGFYMAVSNLGSPNSNNSMNDSKIVRIYCNFSPEGAVTLMKGMTQQLNEIKIPFVFKALHNPADYGRYDSGVLYFKKNHYQLVWRAIQKIYTENREYFYREIPLFTKFLAPGLGLAEQPDFKFSPQESFGTNRCQMIALGLLEAWQKKDVSPKSRMASILKYFAMFRVNLQRPYLNSDSEDIYSPLN